MFYTYNKIPENIKKKYKNIYEALDQYSGNTVIMLSNAVYKNGDETEGYTILRDITVIVGYLKH